MLEVDDIVGQARGRLTVLRLVAVLDGKSLCLPGNELRQRPGLSQRRQMDSPERRLDGDLGLTQEQRLVDSKAVGE